MPSSFLLRVLKATVVGYQSENSAGQGLLGFVERWSVLAAVARPATEKQVVVVVQPVAGLQAREADSAAETTGRGAVPVTQTEFGWPSVPEWQALLRSRFALGPP